MTYRDRRAARAERLREWAEKREERARATLASHEVYRGDHAFNFQPGHIPQRARVIAQEDRAYDSLRKADRMTQRAAGIEAQLDRSIYSDDPDAIPALELRVRELEAKRERIKAYNASVRRGARDLSLLDEAERADLLGILRVGFGGKDGAFPPFVLSNLNGNIKRNRDRLEALRRGGQTRLRTAPTRRRAGPGGEALLCAHCEENPATTYRVMHGIAGPVELNLCAECADSFDEIVGPDNHPHGGAPLLSGGPFRHKGISLLRPRSRSDRRQGR